MSAINSLGTRATVWFVFTITGPRTPPRLAQSAHRFWRLWLLTLALTLPPRFAVPTAAAQDAWVVVPVFEGPTPHAPPVEGLVTPWEQALHRVAHNRSAAELYEKRQSAGAPPVSESERTQLRAAVAAALERLALGELEEGRRLLEPFYALPDVRRESLLLDSRIAKQVFDACMMQAHLLMREKRTGDADQLLLACVRDYQTDLAAPSEEIALKAPPQLRAAFERARAAILAERHGTLVIESTPSGCPAFVNGLAAGPTPVRVPKRRSDLARVRVICADKPGRIHPITLERGEQVVRVDARFDASVSTLTSLQLRYASMSEREAHLTTDGRTLMHALGVDRIAWLLVQPSGNAWSITLAVSDERDAKARRLGELSYSEAAGYEPERLRDLSAQLRTEAKPSSSAATTGPVLLSPRPNPRVEPAVSFPQPRADQGSLTRTAGLVMGAVGLVGVAGSWVLLADRRSFRLRNRDVVTSDDEAAYAKRGTWTAVSGGLGAGLLAISPYFWFPEPAELGPVVWAIGGVGLAVTALGVASAVLDDHCGPERGGELREPCRSVRADGLFGVELALTGLPFAALPLTVWLRSLVGDDTTSFSVVAHRDGLMVRVVRSAL